LEKVVRQGWGGTVLVGDLNDNSKCWDPRCTDWREATYREVLIDENWLVIGNDD
jgi:hypothetical protein